MSSYTFNQRGRKRKTQPNVYEYIQVHKHTKYILVKK